MSSMHSQPTPDGNAGMEGKSRVFVTRHLPQPALDLLDEHAEVEVWSGELPPPREVLLQKVGDVDGLLALLTDCVDAALLDAAPRLRVVSNYAVGYDNVVVPAATERGVLVTNTPDVLTEATADFTMALLLAAARRIVESAQYVKAGLWKTWGPEILLGREVSGATLGLVGLGRIGQAVARRAAGFGMRILYTAPAPKPEQEAAFGLEYMPLEHLLQQSDFVSLHCPLTNDTRHLLNRDRLEQMKPTAIVVNTARGAVIDTDALVDVLRRKPIIAALDVTDPEPLPADHPLLALPNALVVPHVASATVETRTRMALVAARNLIAALRGERPPFLVNPEAWNNRRGEATHRSMS
ncbi:MAG TPA: D-glycerate dehydrogenase [Herpetosiphonaceae bacterium]|nr:D-glycerate dehydrogenase [Herpetosiphonaceae bacterium]